MQRSVFSIKINEDERGWLESEAKKRGNKGGAISLGEVIRRMIREARPRGVYASSRMTERLDRLEDKVDWLVERLTIETE